MTKKTLSLIQAIIETIAIVFLFVPGVYSQKYFYSAMNGSRPTTKNFAHSLFKASDVAACTFTAIILIALMALTIVYFTLAFTSNNSLFKKKFMIAAPCIQIAGLILNMITVTSWKFSSGATRYGTASHSYGVSWGFFVLCAFVVIVILLEVFRLYSNLPEKKIKTEASKTSVLSQDLREIQDLLNQGIITEEEFNAKKKQLLGL